MRTDPRPLNCISPPFLRWLSWCDQFLYRCEDNGELTRDLPIARSHHHATNAVHPGASPAHRVFLEQAIRFLRGIQFLVRVPKAPSGPGNHMRFKSSGSLPSAVAGSIKACSLGRGVGSLRISSQRSSSTCASSRNLSKTACLSASLSFGSSWMISDALTVKS